MEQGENNLGQPQVNQSVHFRALGTKYKVLSSSLNGSAAIVEHTLEARSLGAPMHKHTYEDEISYVLEGRLSVVQNGEIQTAGVGEYVVKPRGIFHTFWNPGSDRIRFIEVITPGNFSNYFFEIAPFLQANQPLQLDKISAIIAKYGLIVDMAAGVEIIKKYGLNALS